MTYEDFLTALLEIDPEATEYFFMPQSPEKSYTVVVPVRETWLISDDYLEDAVLQVQINHYSQYRSGQFLKDFLDRFLDTSISIDDPVRTWDQELELHRLIITVTMLGDFLEDE